MTLGVLTGALHDLSASFDKLRKMIKSLRPKDGWHKELCLILCLSKDATPLVRDTGTCELWRPR